MAKWPAPTPRRFLLLVLVYAALQVLINPYSTRLGWTILWPLNGLTIAMLLRSPRRQWGWLLLAVELGTGCGELLNGEGLPLIGMQRLCSAGEVLLCVGLLPAFTSIAAWLALPRITRRVILAVAVGPTVSGVFAAWGYHWLQGESLLQGWNWWATPDMLGIAVTLPAMLILGSKDMHALFERGQRLTTFGILGLCLCVSLAIFFFHTYPLLFLLYPMLLYVEWRLGFAGASIGLIMASVIGAACTAHHIGPFGHWAVVLALPQDTALQIYLGFHAMALLPLSLMMLERRNTAEQLSLANTRLELLARQDALTELTNRRGFNEALDNAWAAAAGDRTALSLLMIDIDYFKQYNDRHGHLVGDACLVQVANLVRQAAGDDLCVARFGGEEFVVLLPATGVQGSFRVAEQIRRAVVHAAILHEDSTWGIVTLSVGCATMLPALGGNTQALLAASDSALYEAKKGGRNRQSSAVAQEEDLRDLYVQELASPAALSGVKLPRAGVLPQWTSLLHPDTDSTLPRPAAA